MQIGALISQTPGLSLHTSARAPAFCIVCSLGKARIWDKGFSAVGPLGLKLTFDIGLASDIGYDAYQRTIVANRRMKNLESDEASSQ